MVIPRDDKPQIIMLMAHMPSNVVHIKEPKKKWAINTAPLKINPLTHKVDKTLLSGFINAFQR